MADHRVSKLVVALGLKRVSEGVLGPSIRYPAMTVFALDEMGAFIMIDLSEVAFTSEPDADGVSARFGLYLPGIDAGFQVAVLVIIAADRLTAGIRAAGVQPAAGEGRRVVDGGGDDPPPAGVGFRPDGALPVPVQLLSYRRGTRTCRRRCGSPTLLPGRPMTSAQLSAFTTPGRSHPSRGPTRLESSRAGRPGRLRAAGRGVQQHLQRRDRPAALPQEPGRHLPRADAGHQPQAGFRLGLRAAALLRAQPALGRRRAV